MLKILCNLSLKIRFVIFKGISPTLIYLIINKGWSFINFVINSLNLIVNSFYILFISNLESILINFSFIFIYVLGTYKSSLLSLEFMNLLVNLSIIKDKLYSCWLDLLYNLSMHIYKGNKYCYLLTIWQFIKYIEFSNFSISIFTIDFVSFQKQI